MKPSARLLLPTLLTALLLVACGKKAPKPEAAPAQPEAAATAPAPAPAPAPAVAPAAAPAPGAAAAPVDGLQPTPYVDIDHLEDEQRQMAVKKGKLDFSTMEDGFMTDARAQWAATATASSTYSTGYAVNKAVGKVDGETWANKNSSVGFDTLETTFEKPVNATELRYAIYSGDGLDGVSKLELQDVDGKWNTVWSGVHNVKRDTRGPRTWLVDRFAKTPYKAKAARITVSNNLANGTLTVDAVQLVGE